MSVILELTLHLFTPTIYKDKSKNAVRITNGVEIY